MLRTKSFMGIVVTSLLCISCTSARPPAPVEGARFTLSEEYKIGEMKIQTFVARPSGDYLFLRREARSGRVLGTHRFNSEGRFISSSGTEFNQASVYAPVEIPEPEPAQLKRIYVVEHFWGCRGEYLGYHVTVHERPGDGYQVIQHHTTECGWLPFWW